MDKEALETSLHALDVWLIVLGLVVVAGLAGESIVGFLHLRRGGQLHRLQVAENLKQQVEIERLRTESEATRRDTASAVERAAKAEKDAALANEKAEGEHLARVKIEEKMAPRRLSEDQLRVIASRLAGSAGTRLNFFAYSGDTEIEGIGNDILRSLTGPNSARWLVTISSGQVFGPSAVSGIDIEVTTPGDPRTEEVARMLAEALREQRLVVTGPHGPRPAPAMVGQLVTDPQAKIKLAIGRKP